MAPLAAGSRRAGQQAVSSAAGVTAGNAAIVCRIDDEPDQTIGQLAQAGRITPDEAAEFVRAAQGVIV